MASNYLPLPRLIICMSFVLWSALLINCGFALAGPGPLEHSFDLRDVGGRAFIGPVKNQDPMGTCYAFGAVAAAESTYNRAMNLYDENAARFSESFIVWSLSPHYEGFDPYSGANFDYDELQAIVDHGLPHEKNFPYEIEPPADLHWDAKRTRFSSWHRIPTNDIETMKRVLQTFGATDAAVEVGDAFSEYTDGIYFDDYTSPRTPIEYKTSTNHAISLVGWDDHACGEGQGAWILRNSWGPSWGMNGYMLIDYTSAAVATSATYLVYGDWPGDDFALSNFEEIKAPLQYLGSQPVARGMYEWGGNAASISNFGQILAEASVESGSPYVHGIFLWAGANSSVTNNEVIKARASTANGQATAYGICTQGQDVANSGFISAEASSHSGARATAYGVRQLGFDLDASFENTGSIFGEAHTEDGWAYGYFGNRVGNIHNAGHIQANATAQATGLLAEESSRIINTGLIKADSDTGSAAGAFILSGTLDNHGVITASGSEAAYGLLDYTYDADNRGDFTNTGTIAAFSESGSAIGASLYGSTLVNSGEISARTTTGSATAIIAFQSYVTNNGRIIGDTIIQDDSTLSGSGFFNGPVSNIASHVAPGNSIGTLTIDGDYFQDEAGSLVLEFACGQHDVLDVSGTATLDGELRLVLLDYQGGGAYSVLDAGDVEGSFAVVNAPAVLNAALRTAPSGLDLDLTRNTYASLAANSGQGSVGRTLDQFRTKVTGDMDSALLRIDNMNLDDVRDALTDMAPGIQAATRRNLIDLPHSEANTLLDRLAEKAFRTPESQQNATAKATDENPGYAVWGNVASKVGTQGPRDVIPALDSQSTNLFLGVERDHGRWNTGLTGALLEHTLDSEKDASGAKITSARVYLHALWRQHVREAGPYMAASLGAGRSRITSVRDVTFLDKQAEAQHWAHDVSLGIGAGHVLIAGAWRIQPNLKMTGLYLHEDSATEHGAAPINLDVASTNIHSLRSTVGLRVGRTIFLDAAALLPVANIQWTHAVTSDHDHVQAHFNDYNPGVEIDSDAVRDGLLLSLGLDIEAQNLRGGLRYEYSGRNGGEIEEHQVNLGIHYYF